MMATVALDSEMVARVLAGTAAVQHRFDQFQKPEKIAAKKRAGQLLAERLPEGGRLLDVGGEDFYHQFLGGFEIVTHNLPDHDMHEMTYVAEFDAVLAMHVLEHSPFPLYVLALLHRALRPGGFLYVAVPTPCNKFCRKFGHWSVMPAKMWKTLLKGAGFEVVTYEQGKFGPDPRWVEERFLCRVPV